MFAENPYQLYKGKRTRIENRYTFMTCDFYHSTSVEGFNLCYLARGLKIPNLTQRKCHPLEIRTYMTAMQIISHYEPDSEILRVRGRFYPLTFDP